MILVYVIVDQCNHFMRKYEPFHIALSRGSLAKWGILSEKITRKLVITQFTLPNYDSPIIFHLTPFMSCQYYMWDLLALDSNVLC